MQAAGHGRIYSSFAELNIYIMFRDLSFMFTRKNFTVTEKLLVIGPPSTLYHLFCLQFTLQIATQT